MSVKYATIYIKEKEFDKRRAEAKKESETSFGDDEDSKNLLTFDNINPNLEELYLEDDELSISINTDVGDIYLTVVLTKEIEIDILQNAVKKFNKAKQFLENMKE